MASNYFFGWDRHAGTSATSGSFVTSGTSTFSSNTISSTITEADVRMAQHMLLDEREHYEAEKRRRSGVWKYESRFDTNEEIWTLDLALLNDKLQEMMIHDRDQFQIFARHPRDTLDALFGRGTAKAYFTRRRDPTNLSVSMRKRKPLTTAPKRIAFGGATVPFKLREKAGRVVKSVIEDGGDLLGSLERDSQLWLKSHLAIIRE